MSDVEVQRTKSFANPELDALRFIAFFMVFFVHFPYNAKPVSLFGFDFTTQFLKGWIGVDVFFVLSGFLLTRQLIKKIDQGVPGVIWKFMKRRAFRTWPSYYFLILVLTFLLPLWSSGPWAEATFVDRGSLAQIAREFLYLTNYLHGTVLPLSWSLCVEEHFYVILPLALVLFRVKHNKGYLLFAASIAFLILGLVLRYQIYQDNLHLKGDYMAFEHLFYLKTHLHMDGLVMGSILGYLEARNPRWVELCKRYHYAIWPPFLITGAFLYKYAFRAVEFESAVIAFPIAGIWSSCLLLLAQYNNMIKRLFSWKIYGWFAERTYAYYLVHMTLVGDFVKHLMPSFFSTFPSLPTTGWGAFSLTFFLYLALTMISGEAIFKGVEYPFLLLRNKYARW
jgi:peptidoglycan/LPS O-acetylase OafA/YrhL